MSLSSTLLSSALGPAAGNLGMAGRAALIGGTIMVCGSVAYATWTDQKSFASRMSLVIARLLAGLGILVVASGAQGALSTAGVMAVEIVLAALLLHRPRVEILLTPIAAATLVAGHVNGGEASSLLIKLAATTPVCAALVLVIVWYVARFERARSALLIPQHRGVVPGTQRPPPSRSLTTRAAPSVAPEQPEGFQRLPALRAHSGSHQAGR